MESRSPSSRFTRWVLDDATALAAILEPDRPRMGIYILEFSDGERYVGQTVDLLSRFASHRRRWPGEIVAVSFLPAERERLNQIERDVISRLAAQGVSLRNIDLVSLPLRSDALDVLVDRQEQAEWLDGRTEPCVIGDRAASAGRRRRARSGYERLRRQDAFDDVVAMLACYVRRCLPWPHVTEGRFWMVTALPSTGRRPDWRRLAAISVNNVETLVIGEALGDGRSRIEGFINVAADTDVSVLDPGVHQEVSYGPVGAVRQIFTDTPDELAAVLAAPELAGGAARLAMGLLRKGPSMFARFHNDHLADDVFCSIAEQLEESPDPGVHR